jgi:hypothetical protein
MTREEMRAAAREAVKTWPPLTEAQRLELAVILRPDLPVGIQREPKRGRRDAAA